MTTETSMVPAPAPITGALIAAAPKNAEPAALAAAEHQAMELAEKTVVARQEGTDALHGNSE